MWGGLTGSLCHAKLGSVNGAAAAPGDEGVLTQAAFAGKRTADRGCLLRHRRCGSEKTREFRFVFRIEEKMGLRCLLLVDGLK